MRDKSNPLEHFFSHGFQPRLHGSPGHGRASFRLHDCAGLGFFERVRPWTFPQKLQRASMHCNPPRKWRSIAWLKKKCVSYWFLKGVPVLPNAPPGRFEHFQRTGGRRRFFTILRKGSHEVWNRLHPLLRSRRTPCWRLGCRVSVAEFRG